MGCAAPEGCRRRAERHYAGVDRRIEAGRRELDAHFRLPADQREIVPDAHQEMRMFERVLPWHAVLEIIEVGEVIDRWHLPHKGVVHTAILGYVLVAKRKYRPFHIVVEYFPDDLSRLTVKTSYDPSTRPWQWTPDFRRRLCWCRQELKD